MSVGRIDRFECCDSTESKKLAVLGNDLTTRFERCRHFIWRYEDPPLWSPAAPLYMRSTEKTNRGGTSTNIGYSVD